MFNLTLRLDRVPIGNHSLDKTWSANLKNSAKRRGPRPHDETVERDVECAYLKLGQENSRHLKIHTLATSLKRHRPSPKEAPHYISIIRLFNTKVGPCQLGFATRREGRRR